MKQKLSDEWWEGYEEFENDLDDAEESGAQVKPSRCPYDVRSAQGIDWTDGWCQAEQEIAIEHRLTTNNNNW